jgi:hypothetical protein
MPVRKLVLVLIVHLMVLMSAVLMDVNSSNAEETDNLNN